MTAPAVMTAYSVATVHPCLWEIALGNISESHSSLFLHSNGYKSGHMTALTKKSVKQFAKKH